MSKKLYFNGTILTMDDACPRADYVLTEDNRILAAGGKQDIPDALSAGAQPVDLQGRVLLPAKIRACILGDDKDVEITGASDHVRVVTRVSADEQFQKFMQDLPGLLDDISALEE